MTKSIPMDVDTMTLISSQITAADLTVVSYDPASQTLTGPDDAIGRITAINVAAAQKTSLIQYAAAKRYALETGGTTVSGVPVATDRESQAMLNAAFNMAQLNSNFTTMWKGSNGAFTQLTAAQIIAIAQAVGAYVASCFAAEAAAVNSINAGNITTKTQIDSAIVVPSGS